MTSDFVLHASLSPWWGSNDSILGVTTLQGPSLCRDYLLTSSHSKVKDLSVQYARDIRSVYEPAVKPSEPSPTSSHTPFGGVTPVSVPRSASGVDEDQRRTPQTRKTLPEQVPNDESDSGISSGDTFENLNMAALKQRGKGNYSCPKGKWCTRGGVDKEGNVIIFDRNSAFV